MICGSNRGKSRYRTVVYRKSKIVFAILWDKIAIFIHVCFDAKSSSWNLRHFIQNCLDLKCFCVCSHEFFSFPSLEKSFLLRKKKSFTDAKNRPNLVVKGDGVPFIEDMWSRIRIGNVTYSLVKPCARCKATTVDNDTGKYDGEEPLRTLQTFRTKPKREVSYDVWWRHRSLGPWESESWQGVFFGQNLTQENTGRVSVGDKVYLLNEALPE